MRSSRNWSLIKSPWELIISSNKQKYVFKCKTIYLKFLKKSNDGLNGEENNSIISYDILKNSQAFNRITELARKVGAINIDEEYLVDKLTGRLKPANQRDSSSSSSGVSSLSSIFNAENLSKSGNTDQVDRPEFNNNTSINSPDLIQHTDNEANSFTSSTQIETHHKNLAVSEEELVNMQFTACVRELFLQKFVQMFVSYEKFVIVPNLETTNIESWWTCREYTGNFDSKMFLIEQPSPRLPFLSHFIATQMFASFIDLKIVSLIDPLKATEPNVKVFKPFIIK